MIVLGGITVEELEYINNSWRKDLPTAVAEQLLDANDNELYFYRKKDTISALVNTHFVL